MAIPIRFGWRQVLIAGACAAAVLTSRPAAADDAELGQWARQVAAPQLLVVFEAADNDGSRDLAALLRASLDTDGAAHFPVHDTRFWTAAVESRGATEAAVAVRLLALAADGDVDAIAPYQSLILRLADGSAVATELLAELLNRLPVVTNAWTTVTPLELGDRALDEGDFALAALAYRVVLLDSSPEQYGFRDIAGHYFYCLHALHASPDVQSARARFNTTVVFPSVETQSRARITATTVPAEPFTTTAAAE